MDNKLQLNTQFDRSLIYHGGKSVRYLVVEFNAPKSDRQSERPPLNLALVIDASGSMQGKPLEFAKEAACGVIRGLNEQDVLSVVSFANDVMVHIDGIKLDAAGKNSAINAVQKLHTRGHTNLSAGWLKGAECVAVASEGRHGFHNHVIVLSDGWANQGICDPQTLQAHAEGLRMRSIYTSAVGIGAEYSPTQLEALANYGGGQLHDAQHPPEIVEVVLGELNELGELYADDLSLTVWLPAGVKIEMLSPYPVKLKSDKLIASLGSLVSGAMRLAIMRVIMPHGRIGDEIEFRLEASWRVPGQNTKVSAEPVEEQLVFADEHQNSSQTKNVEATLHAARVWQAAIVKQSVEMNRSGNLRALRSYLEQEMKQFSRLIQDIAAAQYLMDELDKLLIASQRSWSESTRKQIYNQNYKSAKQETDHRSQESQAPWWTHLTSD